MIYFPGGYLKRNFQRWARQYEASKTGEIESMDKLIDWLPKNMPDNERCTIVHGDFRWVGYTIYVLFQVGGVHVLFQVGGV